MGKTRLALELAHHIADRYHDGVTLVNLAPLDNPDLLPDAVAKALEVQEKPGESLSSTLKRYFSGRQCLLLLDNCEHVLPGIAPVATWLAASPQLTVLATSREPLRLYGEQLYAVQPLATDARSHKLSPAMQLFADRARAARASFMVDEEEKPVVAEICALLDGLPLAIELAAARSRHLSPAALLKQLSDGASRPLQLLSGGPRDVQRRQQTISATIDWSYHLLDAGEQQLFRHLALFAGGCTLDAVDAICRLRPRSSSYVLDLLSSLADKHLLQIGEMPAGEPRFWLLHVMREYGRERLQRLGEMPQMQERHARYYLEVAEEAEPELTGPQQAHWLNRLEREHDNFRAALRWALEADRAQIGLRMANALWRFWLYRNHSREGRQWLEEMLALDHGASARLRAHAFYALGELAQQRHDLPAARAAHEEGLALRRREDDRAGSCDSLTLLGIVLREMGDYPEADELMAEALAMARKMDHPHRIAYALTGLAMSATEQGRQPEARAMLEETLDLMRSQGDLMGVWSAYNNLGLSACYAGDYERALQLLEHSQEVVRPLEAPYFDAFCLLNISLVEARQGRFRAAAAHVNEILPAFAGNGDRLRITDCLEILATVAFGEGRLAATVTYWGAASALREQLRSPLPPVEQRDRREAEAKVRQSLAAAAYEQAWEEGRRLALEALDALLAFAAKDLRAAEVRREPAPDSGPRPALTPRETEVLQLVAQGLTDAQVAETLVISPRTVNAHLSSVYSKLGVNSRTAATLVAQQYGIV